MLEIIDKGLTTRAHETPLLFVHGGHHAAWCWNEREPRRSAKSCLLTHVGIIGTCCYGTCCYGTSAALSGVAINLAVPRTIHRAVAVWGSS